MTFYNYPFYYGSSVSDDDIAERAARDLKDALQGARDGTATPATLRKHSICPTIHAEHDNCRLPGGFVHSLPYNAAFFPIVSEHVARIYREYRDSLMFR